MPKFRIGLVQTVYEETTIEVEAETKEQAQALAVLQVYDEGRATWSFSDSKGDAEVVFAEAAQ